VELLIVDVNFARLGLNVLAPGLGLERHVCFLFFDGIPLWHCRNDRVGGVRWKLEGWFLDTVLPLQVVTLDAPMRGNGNGVAIALEVEEKSRISCGNGNGVAIALEVEEKSRIRCGDANRDCVRSRDMFWLMSM
jgi:hypothetical protein